MELTEVEVKRDYEEFGILEGIYKVVSWIDKARFEFVCEYGKKRIGKLTKPVRGVITDETGTHTFELREIGHFGIEAKRPWSAGIKEKPNGVMFYIPEEFVAKHLERVKSELFVKRNAYGRTRACEKAKAIIDGTTSIFGSSMARFLIENESYLREANELTDELTDKFASPGERAAFGKALRWATGKSLKDIAMLAVMMVKDRSSKCKAMDNIDFGYHYEPEKYELLAALHGLRMATSRSKEPAGFNLAAWRAQRELIDPAPQMIKPVVDVSGLLEKFAK